MEPVFKILPISYLPQQKEFFFEDDNLKFTSKFDSGNMLKVEKRPKKKISEDCYGTQLEFSYRTWFFFSIKNFSNRNKKIKIYISNMSNLLEFFKDGYKFVYRMEDLNYNHDGKYEENEEFLWRRFSGEINAELRDQNTIELGFDIEIEVNKQCFLAFCYPWSYLKNLKFLEHLEEKKNLYSDSSIYYDRSLLTFSKEKRYVQLITITSIDPFDRKQKNNLLQTPCPFSNPIITKDAPKSADYTKKYEINANNAQDKNTNKKEKDKDKAKDKENIILSNNRGLYTPRDKPIIFISARTHAGETPSSFVLNGFLKFLTDKKDPRAEILRKAFVFKIIPMVNVDGVSRGFYRYDSNGLNLNRHFEKPGRNTQPEIFAMKRIFLHFNTLEKIKFYLDLHSHTSLKGLFVYGNFLEFSLQIENQMIPKLIEINSEYLNLEYCELSTKGLKNKERGDMYSKLGTARHQFFKINSEMLFYTVEISYFSGESKNKLEKISAIDFNIMISPSTTKEFNENKEKEILEDKKNAKKILEKNSDFEENPEKSILDESEIKNTSENLKKEEELKEKKRRRIESLNLLMILSKYFRIEIDKVFFKEKEILRKAIKNVKKNEKINYEKVKNINLNTNSSFTSTENMMTNKNNVNIRLDSINETNKESDNFHTSDINNFKKPATEFTIERNGNLFSDLDENENNRLILNKVLSDNFLESKKNFNSIQNDAINKSEDWKSNNNNLGNFNTTKKTKISYDINKEEKYFNSLKPYLSNTTKNNTVLKIEKKNKDNEINQNEKDYFTKVIKKIKDFNTIDYEEYSKIMFYEYFYYQQEANSPQYPKDNNPFSLCFKEEETNFYTPISFEKMGISVLIAILDYEKLNPFSRLGNTEYKSIESLRVIAGNYVFNSEVKFKSSSPCKNIIEEIHNHKKANSINQKIVDILTDVRKKKKTFKSLNFGNRNIFSKLPNLNIDNCKPSHIDNSSRIKKTANFSEDNTTRINDFIKHSNNQDPEEMRKFIYKFNVARTLINNNTELKGDIDKKIPNSEDLFFDGRDLSENKNNNLDLTFIINENAIDIIKDNRQLFFDYNIEIINKREIKTSHDKRFSSMGIQANSTKKNTDISDFNLTNLNNLENSKKAYNEMKMINPFISPDDEKKLHRIDFKILKNFDTMLNSTITNKDININNQTLGDCKNKDMNLFRKQKSLSDYNISINNNTIKNDNKISYIPSKNNVINSIRKKTDNILLTNRSKFSKSTVKYNNLKSEKTELNSKRIIISIPNRKENIILSGDHGAKLRILRGLNKNENFNNSESYLDVKCVGLKANFDSNRSQRKNNDTSINSKNSNKSISISKSIIKKKSFGEGITFTKKKK